MANYQEFSVDQATSAAKRISSQADIADGAVKKCEREIRAC